jgi:hypothetical protein
MPLLSLSSLLAEVAVAAILTSPVRALGPTVVLAEGADWAGPEDREILLSSLHLKVIMAVAEYRAKAQVAVVLAK